MGDPLSPMPFDGGRQNRIQQADEPHLLALLFKLIGHFVGYHTTKRNLELQFVPDKKVYIEKLLKRKQPPETKVERFTRLTGVNPCLCPVCKTAKMLVVRELPRIRSPAWFLFTRNLQKY